MRELLLLGLLAMAAGGEDADPVERGRLTGADATSPAEQPGTRRTPGSRR